MVEKVNIGQAIREEMDRTGRTVTWLSKQLGTNRMTCYRIFNSFSIDTQMLLRISVLLGRDFFELYSSAIHEESVSKLNQ